MVKVHEVLDNVFVRILLQVLMSADCCMMYRTFAWPCSCPTNWPGCVGESAVNVGAAGAKVKSDNESGAKLREKLELIPATLLVAMSCPAAGPFVRAVSSCGMPNERSVAAE